MIKQLLIYQEEDAKLRAIKKELNESEECKKALSAQKYLKGVNDNVNKLDDKAEELIAQYKNALEEQKKSAEFIKELSSAVDNMADEGEGEYLNKKIEKAYASLKTLKETIAQLANQVQAVLTDYSNIKKTTKAAQAQYEQYGKKFNELKESKKAEIEAIEAKLSELEKTVDKALMEKYVQKRDNKVFPVVKYTNGTSCGYCGMEFSLGEKSSLKNGEMLECPQCGRLNCIQE